MVTIDWATQGIGVAVGIVVGFLGGLFIRYVFKRKPKVDLHNLKKLVYDNAIKTKEVYESFKELEGIFKEMEVK